MQFPTNRTTDPVFLDKCLERVYKHQYEPDSKFLRTLLAFGAIAHQSPSWYSEWVAYQADRTRTYSWLLRQHASRPASYPHSLLELVLVRNVVRRRARLVTYLHRSSEGDPNRQESAISTRKARLVCMILLTSSLHFRQLILRHSSF